ncbi:MAG TPA: hypothetical protein GXZ56_11655, partial [Bacteroidales bacterium]|nr:hypothetical protein [Bacteroidales bacterium]
LDVNMSRLLKRYFIPGEMQDVRNDKEIQELAKKVTNVKACKELNWSILDFSALVCKVRKPLCEECVLRSKCSFRK